MTEPDSVEHDHLHRLMMAVLDGECTEADRQELAQLVVARPEVAVEWHRLQRVKEVTMHMGVRQPPDEIWDRYRESTIQRVERGVAWTLVAIGGALLAGWASWQWLTEWLGNAGVPLVIRIAGVALAAGLFLLLVSAARERWYQYRRDPYSKEVIR